MTPSVNVNGHEVQIWTGFYVFCISFISWSISAVSRVLQQGLPCAGLVSITSLFSLNPVGASWQLICHSGVESLLLLRCLHPGKAAFQPSTPVTHNCTQPALLLWKHVNKSGFLFAVSRQGIKLWNTSTVGLILNSDYVWVDLHAVNLNDFFSETCIFSGYI